MRYTTVIDISEFPALYRNHNARLVYLHLALKSGYHDDDRDLIDISIRSLAATVGLTVSATRHSLRILEQSEMIARDGQRWRVRKFFLDVKPQPRRQATTTKASTPEMYDVAAQTAETNDRRRERELLRQENQRRRSEWFMNAGRDELQAALKALQSGKSYRNGATIIAPSDEDIEAIKKKLEIV